jgi:ElaB/YqjD/DUF883 family membrane-anchored ribosome-binding protein
MAHASSHAAHVARNARKGAEDIRDTARDAAHDFKETAQEAASNIVNKVRDMGANMGEAVRDGFDDLRGTAGRYVKQGSRKARELEEAMEDRVQERPVAAIFLALGIGFAVGFLCSRR